VSQLIKLDDTIYRIAFHNGLQSDQLVYNLTRTLFAENNSTANLQCPNIPNGKMAWGKSEYLAELDDEFPLSLKDVHED